MAQSSLCGKMSFELKLNVSADKYFSIWSSAPYLVAKHCPEIIYKVDLLEGQWGKPGCAVVWDYNIGGKRVSSTNIMEVIDYDNKRIEHKVINGSVLEAFKTFKFVLEVAPKSNNKECSVYCVFEYEKLSENIPDPNALMEIFINMSKAVGASKT